MAKKNIDFESKFEDIPQQKKEKKDYNYASADRKSAMAFSLNMKLQDKINRAAYWSEKNRSQVVEIILERYFKDKDFDPIPEKKPKVEI